MTIPQTVSRIFESHNRQTVTIPNCKQRDNKKREIAAVIDWDLNIFRYLHKPDPRKEEGDYKSSFLGDMCFLLHEKSREERNAQAPGGWRRNNTDLYTHARKKTKAYDKHG